MIRNVTSQCDPALDPLEPQCVCGQMSRRQRQQDGRQGQRPKRPRPAARKKSSPRSISEGMGPESRPTVLRSRGMTCPQTARTRQKAEGPALPNGSRQILLIRTRNAKIILTSDSQITSTDSAFPSPPSPHLLPQNRLNARDSQNKTSPAQSRHPGLLAPTAPLELLS